MASFTIKEWKQDNWVPYKSDIQIELVMLDPYIRKTLEYKGDVRAIYIDTYGENVSIYILH